VPEDQPEHVDHHFVRLVLHVIDHLLARVCELVEGQGWQVGFFLGLSAPAAQVVLEADHVCAFVDITSLPLSLSNIVLQMDSLFEEHDLFFGHVVRALAQSHQ